MQVLVNPDVANDPRRLNAIFNRLVEQLHIAHEQMGEKNFAAVKGVSIWVERNTSPDKASWFLQNLPWLNSIGANPDKFLGIEIANVDNYLDWTRTMQPSLLIHEMAHFYHYTILGKEDARVIAAYQNAKATGLYLCVKHVGGATVRAYAIDNLFDYFAELSEAYFGSNDYYPFNRGQLATYDPVGYRMMTQVWR